MSPSSATFPDGGGWRYLRQTARPQEQAHHPARTAKGHPNLGTAFVHTVIDDHSRLAYAEIHADEKATTAVVVLQRAVAWFAGPRGHRSL
jgi:hypothetical protein